MLFAACGAPFDVDAVVECWAWAESKVAQGRTVVLLFDNATSRDEVSDAITPSTQLHCLHVGDCSSLDDFVLFCALFASRHGVTPADTLRFTGGAFESLAVETERALLLNRLVGEIDVALAGGDPDRARCALGILRETLRTYSGTLSSKVYRRAGDCKILIDACRKRHFSALQDGSLLARSKMIAVEIWRDLFPLLDVAPTIAALAAWSEIAADLQRLRLFVDGGRVALSRDYAAIQKGQIPTLTVMLWLTAYLVRTSEEYLARDDGAAAIAVCVRALESYVKFRLFETNVLSFDADPKVLDLRRTSLADVLFEKYRKQRFGDGIQGALMVLTDPVVLGAIPVTDVLEVVRLRNQCLFAHDVQRLSANDARQALIRVKCFIKQAEAKTPSVGARWDNLMRDSFVLDWGSIRPKLFQPLLP